LIGNLAKLYALLDQVNDRLGQEDFVQVNARGTQISNPVFMTLTQTTGAILSLNKALGLSASQRGVGASEPQKNRDGAQLRAKENLELIKGHSLLAQPE
jgi:hypothetical protein